MRLCVSVSFHLPSGIEPCSIDLGGPVRRWARCGMGAVFLYHGRLIHVGCALHGDVPLIIVRGALLELTRDPDFSKAFGEVVGR